MFGGQTLLINTDTIVFGSIAFIGSVTCFFILAVAAQCIENGYCAACCPPSSCCPCSSSTSCCCDEENCGEQRRERAQLDSDNETPIFIYDEP